jgi:hypothetical protein
MGRETGGRAVRQFVFGIATRTAVRPVAAWKAKSLAFHSLRETLLRCHALGRSQTIPLGTPAAFPAWLGLRLSRAPHHAGLFRAFTSLRRTTPPAPVPARAMGGMIREVAGVGISFWGAEKPDLLSSFFEIKYQKKTNLLSKILMYI